MLQPANFQKPHLTEARKYDGGPHLPPYSILETESGFDIALNLFGASKTTLYVFVSQDRKRLHVMAKKTQSESTAQYLWIFALPADVDPEGITVDSKNDVYVLSLPKKVNVFPLTAVFQSNQRIQTA